MQLGKVLVTGAGGLMGAYVVSELTGKAEVLGYPGTLCEKKEGEHTRIENPGGNLCVAVAILTAQISREAIFVLFSFPLPLYFLLLVFALFLAGTIFRLLRSPRV